MNYEELKPWQINQLVHNQVVCGGRWRVVFDEKGCEWIDPDTGDELYFDVKQAIDGVKDYSKPENAFPIIVENMISIEFDGEYQCDEPASWVNAKSLLTGDSCMYQSDALLAAMIVFLKMKDAEK